MITASQARDIVAQSKQGQEIELQKIEAEIKKLSNKGETLLQYDVASEEWVYPLCDMLNKLGFKAKQLHSKGIEIRW